MRGDEFMETHRELQEASFALQKGRVPLGHACGPKNYDLRHTYSESALNSERDSV
jgi:hypothetical protein